MNFIRKPLELLHRLYKASVIIKGIDGILEIIGGFLLIFFSPLTITNTILFLARTELTKGSRHRLLVYFYQVASNTSLHRRHFYSLLFLSHGALKLILVSGLMRNKVWAYPTTMVIFTAFALYQAFEIYSSPSIPLGIITAVDILVVLLIGREYYAMKRSEISLSP
jgi:uncharacterized membrane protein